jgi:hypothetical protein
MIEVALSGAISVMIAALGYAFKTRADAQGWKTSYEREKDRSDAYAKAEDMTKLGTIIGAEFAKAVGKLPPPPGV